MKVEKMNNLFKKYKEGTTSLEEEKTLFDLTDKENPVILSLGTYIKKNKIEVPENLNEKLWDAFQRKQIRKKRKTIALLSAAASILLIFGLIIGHQKQQQLSYDKKKSLLYQAKKMFENTVNTSQQQYIIYEDDMIVIYTSNE